nr:MAG TPA: hypothetical protein [Caudoviricetes sp.]
MFVIFLCRYYRCTEYSHIRNLFIYFDNPKVKYSYKDFINKNILCVGKISKKIRPTTIPGQPHIL